MTKFFHLIFLLILFSSYQVSAHQTSDSYLNIDLSEQQRTISWSIAVRDLEYAVGLDIDANNKITWSEVLQRQKTLEAYVLSRLSLSYLRSSQKQRCHIENNNLMVDEKNNESYLVFTVISPCLDSSDAKDLSVDYQLLFDIDENHRGLLLIDFGDASTSLVASPENHIFSFASKSISSVQVFTDYIVEGIWHILIGLDHILFLLALLLPSVLKYNDGQWKQRKKISSSFFPIFKIVTAFTIAHSITLSLSVLNIVQLPSQIVEVVIAITVLLTCLHTLRPVFQKSLWKIAFVFGLIHGFGFANVLMDLGLENTALALSLFGFNVGVEVGQLLIVSLFVLFAAVFHQYWWYRTYIFKGGISLTAVLSCVWIVERLFNYEILGI